MPNWTPPPKGFDPLSPGLGTCSRCGGNVRVVLFTGNSVGWLPTSNGVKWICEGCVIHGATLDRLLIDTLLELAAAGHVVYWDTELIKMKERAIARKIASRSPYVRSVVLGKRSWTQADVDTYLPLITPTAPPQVASLKQVAAKIDALKTKQPITIVGAVPVASRRDPHNAEGTRGVDQRRDDIFRKMFS